MHGECVDTAVNMSIESMLRVLSLSTVIDSCMPVLDTWRSVCQDSGGTSSTVVLDEGQETGRP